MKASRAVKTEYQTLAREMAVRLAKLFVKNELRENPEVSVQKRIRI